MPNTDSARRALRKMLKRRSRNKVIRSSLRTALKKTRLVAAEVQPGGSPDAAIEQVRTAIKQIDQSCAKGLIHKNTASRYKSRLQLRLNKSIETAKGTPTP